LAARQEDKPVKIHELKTDPEPFAASLRGDKNYEIRFNDRGFVGGDMLVLRETKHTGKEMADGAPLEYTGRVLSRWVTEVRSNYGMKDGWCVIGVRQA
jgi:hypothetical protein